MSARCSTSAGLIVGMICAIVLVPTYAMPQQTQPGTFRVCADPNNLPFSNSVGAGFENKLAGFVAHIFGEKLAYTWWPQRRGFVRKTLKAHDCDVIMGVPTRLDMVETTRPYYRSTYVFVSRADSPLDISAMTDPRLRTVRIGVQLVGNDGFNTPPAHALGQQGIVNNVTGFPVFGDYREPNPPARIVKAVESGQIDIAAVWGPLAGYFAELSPVKLRLQPITDTRKFAPLRFQFDISMGVRKGDDALKTRLDDVIAHHQPEIDAILKSYGVPLMPLPQSDTAQTGASASAN